MDLGGTKIEAIALDDGGAALARRRVATPREQYEATLDAIAGLVADVERETGRRGSVGVGMPGALSPATGLVKNANSTWLIGRALDRDLAARLERPVRLANDANCFALSEAVDGAGAGGRVVFGVIVGTGTGGGLVVERRVLTGGTRSPASGATTRCRGRARTSGRGRPATAAGPAVSRRSSRARASPGTIASARATPSRARRSSRARRGARRPPRRPSSATRGAWPARSRLCSTWSTPTWWCSAAACHGSSGCTGPFRSCGSSGRSRTASTPCCGRPLHGDSSGVRGAAWLWGPGEA